jgi:hypothetical protein
MGWPCHGITATSRCRPCPRSLYGHGPPDHRGHRWSHPQLLAPKRMAAQDATRLLHCRRSVGGEDVIDLGTWLGAAGLIIAIIAIPASILGTRQWGNRRARVQFFFTSIPLLPDGTREGLLEVTYRDVPVSSPHLVSVTLRNTGPRDVPSAAFDDGRPISISFNQTFYGLTGVRGGARTVSPALGSPAKEAIVRLEPGLLKRGEEWSFSAVLTGPVEVSITSPLVDTDITHVIAESDAEPSDITVRISLPFVSAEVPIKRPRARPVR